MKGAFIFLLALVPFILLSTTDASGTTTLVPAGRIKFGSYCQWYLGYDDNNLCFVGPSPLHQHWYFVYVSSNPGQFLIVSHPVPNKALKVECNPSGCNLKIVPIPQLYNGWALPAGIGCECFFIKEVKGELCSIKSVIKPNLAITVLSNGFVNMTQYVESYNQLFCCPCPVGPTPTPTPPGKVCDSPLGLTQHEVVGRIKKAPDCHQFLGYSNYTWALSLQGPSPAHQHWSFFSGSASTDGSFMIATYPAPNKVLKVECSTPWLLERERRKLASTTTCSLKLVNAPCPLVYETEFCFPGEEYMFTKVKPDDETFVIKSVLRPDLAITINAVNNVLLGTSGQTFCCPQIQPTSTVSVTIPTETPTVEKYSGYH